MSPTYAIFFRNLLRSRLVLAPPEQPEDGRVLHLYRNRAELKKAYAQSQDEVHRLRDRIKLQEGATARARELLESLEQRLAVPASGMQALAHYQLRGLWKTARGRVETLVRELAAQREEVERRAHAAEQNRLVFDAQQRARRMLAEAEHNSADVRGKLAGIQQQLAANQAWWKYFRRQGLLRRQVALQAELRSTDADLDAARAAVEEIEQRGSVEYEGLSLEARRAINRVAIAFAHLIATRLAPTGLIAPATQAMLRSEPDYSGNGPAPTALMGQIAQARSLVLACGASALDVKQFADRLREAARYAAADDTVPTAESLDVVLLARADVATEVLRQNVLREDLFDLGNLLV